MITKIGHDPMYMRFQWQLINDQGVQFVPLTQEEETAYRLGLEEGEKNGRSKTKSKSRYGR